MSLDSKKISLRNSVILRKSTREAYKYVKPKQPDYQPTFDTNSPKLPVIKSQLNVRIQKQIPKFLSSNSYLPKKSPSTTPNPYNPYNNSEQLPSLEIALKKLQDIHKQEELYLKRRYMNYQRLPGNQSEMSSKKMVQKNAQLKSQSNSTLRQQKSEYLLKTPNQQSPLTVRKSIDSYRVKSTLNLQNSSLESSKILDSNRKSTAGAINVIKNIKNAKLLLSQLDFDQENNTFLNSCIQVLKNVNASEIINKTIQGRFCKIIISEPVSLVVQFTQRRQLESVYIGPLLDGLAHTPIGFKTLGLMVFSRGQGRYVGNWFHGLYHGLGKYSLNDGTEYEGGWQNGLMHGHGKFTWPQKKAIYVGEFEKDQRIKGKIYDENFNLIKII